MALISFFVGNFFFFKKKDLDDYSKLAVGLGDKEVPEFAT